MANIINKETLNTIAKTEKDIGQTDLRVFDLPKAAREAFPKQMEFASNIEAEHTEFLDKTMDAATRRATENKKYYNDRVMELEREIREDDLSPEEKAKAREEIHRYEILREKEDVQEREVQEAVVEEHRQYSGTLLAILIAIGSGIGIFALKRK